MQAGGLVLGIVSTFTSDPIAPYIAEWLDLAGLGCKAIHFGPFNQCVQTCMNPLEAFSERVDAVLLLWRVEDVVPTALRGLIDGEENRLTEIIHVAKEIAFAATQLQHSSGIPTILAIPPVPYAPNLDSMSIASGHKLTGCHAEIVRIFEEAVTSNGLLRLDLNMLLAQFGVEHALDWRKWYLYRQPYSEDFWWRIAERTVRLLSAARGSNKKCIVLDCDNTIWGGIVGEDGIEGIALGDDFPGSAFSDFQRQVVSLAKRGIFVAIASKNNPEDVWRVFDEHDGMVLSREQISLAHIGWGDKAKSIEEIACQLNIGVDSIVFIDDSQIEIDQIRSQLPAVTCLLAPEDASELPLLLLKAPYFEQLHQTHEDSIRIRSFTAEKQREEIRIATTPEQFRRELELKLKIGPMRPAHVGRVVQLINKTNQFNLTTRRRSASEVALLLGDNDMSVMVLDLEDRFGAYGIVGVAILKAVAKTWEVDTFLLSCRALGRGVAEAFMATIAKTAREKDFHNLRAYFFPTTKNVVASDFLAEVGFAHVSDERFEAEIGMILPLDPSVTVIPL
jgi:FkbH-like protein